MDGANTVAEGVMDFFWSFYEVQISNQFIFLLSFLLLLLRFISPFSTSFAASFSPFYADYICCSRWVVLVEVFCWFFKSIFLGQELSCNAVVEGVVVLGYGLFVV